MNDHIIVSQMTKEFFKNYIDDHRILMNFFKGLDQNFGIVANLGYKKILGLMGDRTGQKNDQ